MENNPVNTSIDKPNTQQPPATGAPQPQVQYNIPNTPDVSNVPYNAPYNNQGYGAPQGTPYRAPQYTPVNTQPHANTPYVNRGPVYPPSVIYNNSRVGNAPQYHYGNPMPGVVMDQRYYQEQQEKIRLRREKEKSIHNTGNIAGLILIICMVLTLAFSFLIAFVPSLEQLYYSGVGGQSFLSIISSVAVIGVTFFFFRLFLKSARDKKTLKPKYNMAISYSAPKGAFKTVLLVFIGVGGCLLANYISALLMSFLYIFGLESTYSSIQEPSGTLEIILMFVATALVPPLVEEYSMRGVTMSFLSKHGTAFAILASAYMFGIFHGTAAQIPFAFICGLFFGYGVFASGSLWTGIIIHLINNSLSCISSIIIKEFDENAGNMFFYISTAVFIILGIVALLIYIKLYKKEDAHLFKSEENDLPLKTKFGKFLSSPAMIVATVLYLIQALTTLTFTGYNS